MSDKKFGEVHDSVMQEVYSIIPEALFEEWEYREHGRPADSVDSAMCISACWIGDEVESAKIRGDIAALQNIAAACIARTAASTDRYDKFVTGVYAREVPQFLSELEAWDAATGQQ